MRLILLVLKWYLVFQEFVANFAIFLFTVYKRVKGDMSLGLVIKFHAHVAVFQHTFLGIVSLKKFNL